MKYKCMLSKELLATKTHIQVVCVDCKRVTEVWSSNSIGMDFNCPKCGSHGFNRKAIIDETSDNLRSRKS